MTLAAFVEALGELDPQPAAGPAAAIAASLAAGLAELTARVSGDDELADRARALRLEAGPLAQADADAYADFLRNSSDSTTRERTIEIPARLVELAREIAEVAVQAAETGKPKLRGDAAAGALLAEAAARAAANLVAINSGEDDARIDEARAAAGEASRAAARAVQASTTGARR